MKPRRLAQALFAALLLAPGAVLAQKAPDLPPAPRDEDSGTKRGFAPDQRTGHLFIDAATSVTGPAGSFASGIPTSSLAGTGLTVGGLLGVGVGRNAVVEARGNYSLFSAPSGCGTGCSGHGFDLAVGLSYHLAQGIAIDPWISYGVGLRWTTFKAPLGLSGPVVDQVYRGIDVARIAVGGDFYPTTFFGFGPYFEADIGTNYTRADPTLGLAAYAFFHLGVRVALDPIRSGSKARSPAPAAARGGPSAAALPGI